MMMPPAIMLVLHVWSFGNSYYVSTDNIFADVVVEPTGSSFINQRGQRIYQEPIISSRPLPLKVKNPNSYKTQFIQRTADSPFYIFLAYELLIFALITIIT